MLSIIIVNYKNPELLRLCLKSLKNNIGIGFDYEIVVVDIEATPETRNVANEDFPELKKIITYVPFQENVGRTKGVNGGIKAARGDQLFFINADIIPLRGSIESLSRFLRENPNVGLVGPKLLNFDGSRQESCFRFYTPMTVIFRRTFLGYFPFAKKTLDRFVLKDADISKTMDVDWVMGSAMMVSRKAIEKTGPMDEKIFLYFDDVDWAHSFWENGYRVVYFPESEMYHYHRRQSKGSLNVFDALVSKVTRWHITDGFRYFFKHGFI